MNPAGSAAALRIVPVIVPPIASLFGGQPESSALAATRAASARLWEVVGFTTWFDRTVPIRSVATGRGFEGAVAVLAGITGLDIAAVVLVDDRGEVGRAEHRK